jgi:hypothetical protein
MRARGVVGQGETPGPEGRKNVGPAVRPGT